MKDNPIPSSPLRVDSSQGAEGLSRGGSDWNNKVTRRQFLKRTGAATAVTLIAWNLSSQSAHAQEGEAGDSAKVWKKRRYGCKRVISGPSNTPYSQAALDSMAFQYEVNNLPFVGDPQGPPSGNYANNPQGTDPEVLEWWDEPLQVSYMRYRNPQPPEIQNWQNPADGKYYAAYIYDYIEEKFEYEVLPED
jgi:hypothetical protein